MKSECNGLCFRCEHRANYLENGSQPRCECGDIKSSKYACYMYKPVRPVVLSPLNKEDKRPRFAGSFISKREKFERIAEGKIKVKILNEDNVILYWSNLK